METSKNRPIDDRQVVGKENGKLFAAPVNFGYGEPYDFIVARYNTDGSLDTSFDGDGKATVDLGETSGYASDVAMDASGTIVVVEMDMSLVPLRLY